jgi:outer membrane protein assembly factor BamB
MREVLVCLDARTGKEVWRVDFVKQFGTPMPSFGFVCSPLVMGDNVYVQAGASFVSLEKRTGKVVWRTLKDAGGMYGSAFSSVYPATMAGRRQLLVQTRSLLAGIDDKDGKLLWSQPIKAFRGMNILTPVTSGDRIFTSSYGGGAWALDIKPKAEGDLAAEVAWKNAVQAYMCTPVVISGHAYLLLRNRRLTCIDLSTGRETWPETQRFGQYMSLASDGRLILGLDQRGELILFKANPSKFELVGRRKVARQETWAHIAVAGDQLFIRELKAISCWRWAARND